MTTQKQHILIIGGGFAGIKTARELAKHPEHFTVTLLSDRSNFRYYPTLYRTATGGLRSQSCISLEKILPKNVTFVEDFAEKIDRDKRIVHTRGKQSLPYSQLILALGSVTNYFGIKGLEEFSYGVKSVEEVERFKAHLHQQLEDEHQPDLNYVIVGAGPTGIELAGMLPGYLHQIMENHGVKRKAVHIELVEAGPRLLPRAPKATSRAVHKRLSQLGIKLLLNQAVQGETADALMVSGQPLKSHTVVWTAGMANNPFFAANNFTMNDRHKVVVDEHLQAEPHIYVVGDNAATPFSGMAQTALHDGKFVAGNLVRQVEGKSPQAYSAKQPVSIIPAGPKWAAVDWGRFHFYGRIGWLLRELADLEGFRDLEPWWRAAEQWATELGHEEACPTCAETQTE